MFDTQLKHVESALDYLDAGSLDYLEWARVGRAIADFDSGKTGFDLFDGWCSKGSGYNADKVLSQWKSFRQSNNVTIGSLFYLAKDRGWQVEYDSPEEYKASAELRRIEREQREKRRAIEAEQKAKEDAEKLAANRARWESFALLKAPDPYLQKKQLHNAHHYVELRTGSDWKGDFFAWPLFDINGGWAGYERIYHSPNASKRELEEGKVNNKKAGENSKSGSGFYIFGDIDSADRVFVMGGFADALTAHITSRFTTVAVPGEHNIPQIVKSLRDKYPNKDIVAAPDNDDTGHLVAKRAGGLYLIPQGANDWSDLYLSYGAQEVSRQLQLAFGWKQVTVNQKFLDVPILKGSANKLISAKETGKTTSLKKFVHDNPELKTLIISYRVSLLESLAHSFNADLYSDPQMESIGHGLLRGSKRLVCSLDSLWKLAGSHWDLVVMDEAEQGFQHMLAATMANKTLNTDVLAHLLKTAHTTVFMDADLGDLTNGFIQQIGIHCGIEYRNTYQPRQDSNITFYKKSEALSIQILQSLADGESVYVCSNSKGWLEQLSVKIKSELNLTEFKDMMLITSDNSASKEAQEFIESVNNREYMSRFKLLMGSPSIGTGLDIQKGSHNFSKTFAYFTHQTGTAEQAHQQLARARGVTDYHICVSEAYGNKITNPDIIKQLILDERDAETTHFLQLKDGELVVSHPLYEWLYSHCTAILNDNFNRFCVRFEQLARAEGYSIEYAGQNERAEKQMRDQLADIRDQLKSEYTKNAEIMPVLSEFAKDSAHNGNYAQARKEVEWALKSHYLKVLKSQPPELHESDIDKLVGIALLKSQVQKDMNLLELKRDPETLQLLLTELTVEEKYQRRVSALKRLSGAFLPADAAKKRDRKDRAPGKSKAELRHHYQQRRLLLRLLAAAGLNEKMELDPDASWGPAQVRSLFRWMQKNQKSLFKYLNITLSPQNYEEPLRWFNDFLRGLQLPVVSFQRRVNGSGTRYRIYKLDPIALKPIRELVKNRNNGILAHLEEEEQQAYQVAEAQARVNNSNVTQPTVDYINNRGSGVTYQNAPIASVHAASTNSEEAEGGLEIPDTAQASETITLREKAMQKLRKWFPAITKPEGSEAHKGIRDTDLEDYLSETDVKEIATGVICQSTMQQMMDFLTKMGGRAHLKE